MIPLIPVQTDDGGSANPNSLTHINFLNPSVISDTHLPEESRHEDKQRDNTFIQMNSVSFSQTAVILSFSPAVVLSLFSPSVFSFSASLSPAAMTPVCLKETNFNTHTDRRTKPREDLVWGSSKGPSCMYARAVTRAQKRAPACRHANRSDALQHPEQLLQQRHRHLLQSDFHCLYCTCGRDRVRCELRPVLIVWQCVVSQSEAHSLLCHRGDVRSGSVSVSGVYLALDEMRRIRFCVHAARFSTDGETWWWTSRNVTCPTRCCVSFTPWTVLVYILTLKSHYASFQVHIFILVFWWFTFPKATY